MPARERRDEREASDAGPARQRPDANRRNVSIGKAAALLRVASRHPDGASLAALARAAGIPRATASRMVAALEAEGFLTRFPDQDRVLLGAGLLDLAAAVRPERLLVEAARDALAALARTTDETATLAVRHGDVIVGIDEARAAHVIAPVSWVGRSWSLDGTASGLLARGAVPADAVAASVDELELGLASIAARIPGALEAYVTVSGPTFRFDAAARAAAGPPLLAAVRGIGRRLAGPGSG